MKLPGVFLALFSITAFAAPDPALLKKAKTGDTDAMVKLATELESAKPAEAMQWYAKAADLGVSQAQSKYGLALAAGRGVPRDVTKAIPYLEKAARWLDRPALDYLVGLYWTGQDAFGNTVPVDQRKAIDWQEQISLPPAAYGHDRLTLPKLLLRQTEVTEADYARVQKLLARFREDYGVAPDAELTALLAAPRAAPDPSVLRKKAAAGDAAAMFALAESIQLDQPEEAEKWYFKAADLGYAPAEFTAFNILEEQSSMEAAHHQRQYQYLLRAAEHGYLPAQVRLARFLDDDHPMNGEFVGADRKAAAVWYRKAAEQGHPEAMRQWATDLAAGEYVPKDFTASLNFLRKAGFAGDEEAQLVLGFLYEKGEDAFGNKVPVDLRESLRWQRMMVAGGYTAGITGLISSLQALPDPTVAELTELRKLLEKEIADGNVYVQGKLDEVRLKLSKPDPRALALEQLTVRYAAFEKEFDAAASAAGREKALSELGRWIEYDRGGPLSNAEAGEWVLRKLIGRLERFPREAYPLLVAVSDRVFPVELLKRELPPRLRDQVQAEAKRIVSDYQAEQQKRAEISQLLPAANRGDGKAQFALGLAYLSLKDGSKDYWAHATHWLAQAAQARVPGAAAALGKLEQEAGARWQAAVAAKDMAAMIRMYRQKAESPRPDAAEGALEAGRLLSDRVSGSAQNIPEGVKLLQQAAAAGLPDAALELGFLYVLNEDQKIDEAEALRWFRQAGSLGEAEAAAWIELLEPTLDRAARGQRAYDFGGKAMRSNPKVNADFRAASPWFSFAARLGHPDAMAFVASVEKDATKQRDLYVKAAEAGSVKAMEQLAYMIRKSDPKNAREWYLRAAQTGSVLGQESAGWMLLKGEGGPVDLAGARNWLGKAAAQKSGYAMFYLGQMEANGTGTPRNDAEAVKWWTSAAAAGSTDAQYWLGVFYMHGRGMAQDRAKARELFTRASQGGSESARKTLAEMDAASAPTTATNVATTLEQDRAGASAGQAQSMYLMGQRYETGDGVGMDWTIALDWYRKAAAAGHKDAAIAVTELEPALNRDKPSSTSAAKSASAPAKTLAQDREAANLDDADAMFRLGRRYENGDGVTADLNKAWAWYDKAATLGHAAARDAVTAISTRLQKIETEKLAGQAGTPPKPVQAKEPAPSADGALANARLFASRGLDSDAVIMIKRAVAVAETASPANRYMLAVILREGQYGVPKDPTRSLTLLVSSADSRFGPAQVDYGYRLLLGAEGVVADPVKARQYLEGAIKDAEYRNPEDKKAAATVLLNDRIPGMRADSTRAFKLIEAVADSGDAITQFEYGRALYTGGRGLAADQPRGVAYLKKAAETLPDARFLLGQIHERGVNGKPDLAEAGAWYIRAGNFPGAAEAAARLRSAPGAGK